MPEICQEDKDPSEHHSGGRIQVAVLHCCSCHRKVRCHVSNPFSVGEHMVARGTHDIQAHDQDLSSHEQHRHWPRNPETTKFGSGGTNAVVAYLDDRVTTETFGCFLYSFGVDCQIGKLFECVSTFWFHLHTSSLTTIRSPHHLLARRSIKTRHCIKKLDGSIEHEDPGIDIILPPFFLCLRSNRTERLKSEDAMHSTLEPCLHPWGAGCQEHLEMIWSLVRLKVVTSWKPSFTRRCDIYCWTMQVANKQNTQQFNVQTVQTGHTLLNPWPLSTTCMHAGLVHRYMILLLCSLCLHHTSQCSCWKGKPPFISNTWKLKAFQPSFHSSQPFARIFCTNQRSNNVLAPAHHESRRARYHGQCW